MIFVVNYRSVRARLKAATSVMILGRLLIEGQPRVQYEDVGSPGDDPTFDESSPLCQVCADRAECESRVAAASEKED